MPNDYSNPLFLALLNKKDGKTLSSEQKAILAKAERNRAKAAARRRMELEEKRRPLLAAVVQLEIMEDWPLSVVAEKLLPDFPGLTAEKLGRIKYRYKNIYLEEIAALQKRIKQSQVASLIRAQDKLNRLMPSAVDTLGDVMKGADTAAGVKVKAAEAILKRSGFDEQTGAGFSIDPKEAESYEEFIDAEEVELLED